MPSFKSTAALAILSAAGLASATAGGVYMCSGANWTNGCQYYVYGLNTCYALAGTAYADAQSFGPDSGATCYLYSSNNCGGSPGATLNNPGNANLGAWAQSFECVSSGSSAPSGGSGGSSGGSSSGQTYYGLGTVYYQYGVAGSCGVYHSDSDIIVALPESIMNSGLCGKTISATDTTTGITIQATVADTCPGCVGDGVDFSVGAWNELTNNAAFGTFNLEWSFVN